MISIEIDESRSFFGYCDKKKLKKRKKEKEDKIGPTIIVNNST